MLLSLQVSLNRLRLKLSLSNTQSLGRYVLWRLLEDHQILSFTSRGATAAQLYCQVSLAGTPLLLRSPQTNVSRSDVCHFWAYMCPLFSLSYYSQNTEVLML